MTPEQGFALQALNRALWPTGGAPDMTGHELSRTHLELIVSRVLTLISPPINPQFNEAFHVAQAARTSAEKRLYLAELKLDAARRSNGMLAEQVQAARDDADGLRAELDDRATALAIAKTALDAVNARVVALEREIVSASRDTFRELPHGSPMADATRPRCECAACSR